MSGDLGSTLDLPFEENPPGQDIDLATAAICGGLVVMAAVVPVEGEPKAALVFRFAHYGGRFYTPIVLVTDDDQMRKTSLLVEAATNAALRGARKARAS